MKKMKLVHLILIALTLPLFIMNNQSLLFATDKKVGTSGAQFLKIGAGARPTALGNAYVAVAEDANSAYFNPAGISNISRPEFVAMHTEWIANTNYDYGAFCYPLNHGAMAVSAATLKVKDLQRRNNDETTSGNFESLDSAYALTYGHNFSPLFSVGVTGRYVQESIDSYSASTWDSDWGIVKRFDQRNLILGLAVRHVGKPIQFNKESDPLPLTVDGGLSTTLFHQKLLFTADGRFRRDNSPGFGLGFEYRHPLGDRNKFALRTGYDSTVTDAGSNGITLGGGIGIGRLNLEFAWVPFGDLGNTFRYAAHVKF